MRISPLGKDESSVGRTKRKSVFQESALLSGLVTQEQIDQTIEAVRNDRDRAGSPADEERIAPEWSWG